jgi:hypothetical protein
MLDWLFEDVWTVSLVLGVAGVALALAWWCKADSRYRKYLAIGAGIVVVLFGAYFALQFLVETAAKQMERRVREIAGSVKSGEIKPVLEKNLSDDFHVQRYDKREFIARFQALKDVFSLDSVEVWDLRLAEIDREKRIAKFSFWATPKVPGHQTPPYRVEAEFVMTPKENWWQKEEWKMRSFQYFNSLVDPEKPLEIW